MKVLILCGLLISVLLLPLENRVFAQEFQVEVQVDHVANVIEKFNEKVTLFFKFSKEDKYNYQKFLLEKRLAELTYIIGNENWDPIEETSSRYATYLGNFNKFVLSNDLKDKKEEVLSIYQRHGGILEELQMNFEYDSGWWLLLQHDINSTRIFTNQINDSL